MSTDTPLQSTPTLALAAFGVGFALTAGRLVVGWGVLLLRGSPMQGQYGSRCRRFAR